MGMYEFSADISDIQSNIIKIPSHIKLKVPPSSKCKVTLLFDDIDDELVAKSEDKEEKWSFAISHDEFWERLGITPNMDLSDVEEYEIE